MRRLHALLLIMFFSLDVVFAATGDQAQSQNVEQPPKVKKKSWCQFTLQQTMLAFAAGSVILAGTHYAIEHQNYQRDLLRARMFYTDRGHIPYYFAPMSPQERDRELIAFAHLIYHTDEDSAYDAVEDLNWLISKASTTATKEQIESIGKGKNLREILERVMESQRRRYSPSNPE